MAASLTGVALITGGAAGIGKETGFLFAEAGAKAVVFADIDQKGAEEAAVESKEIATNADFRAIAVAVDVRDDASVQAMVDTVVKEFGRIDYSVNCAGVGGDTQNFVQQSSIEEFDKIMSINARGTLLCVRAVSAAMAKQELLPSVTGRHGTRSVGRGSIVNLGSASSYVASPGTNPYTMSKHAIIGLTKAAAVDNFKNGIRVNAVCPGFVDTPMMQKAMARNPKIEPVIKMTPAGRMAAPEEVGNVILFLSSPAASHVNGTGLIIDGGLLLSAHL